MLSTTLIIIILTAITSYAAFTNHKITSDFIFYPPAVAEHNQWYRFWSCSLIHSDFQHLLFNMFSLYMFGDLVEPAFTQLFPGMGKMLYIALYLLSQFFCLVPTYLQNRHNYQYRSLGASGAVSAVVFVGIFLSPTSRIGVLFIPPIIPGFIYAPIYLLISAYMGKRGIDNINHSAHIWGALSGVIFFLIISYTIGHFNAIQYFINQVSNF